jgi:hypothetical protein
VTHFVVLRQSIFAEAGGLAADCSGAQDYDLLLKATEQAKRVHHIRRPIYKWRASETSTSVNHNQKGYANAAGLRALQAAVERRGIQAEVRPGNWKFYYELERLPAAQPRISIIVLPTAATGKTVDWVEKLAAGCRYEDFDIQLLLRGRETTIDVLSAEKVMLRQIEEQESDAAALNRIAEQAAGEHLVFIREGVLPEQENWLKILLGYSMDKECGVVCGMVTDRAGKVENLAVPDISDRSCELFRSFLHTGSVQLNGISCPQHVLTPPFTLCMLEQRLFRAVNGFDHETFPGFFYDLDLSFRLRKEQGVEHIFTPLCPATAPVAGTEQAELACSREQEQFQKKWREELVNNPYYNENRLLEEQQVSRAAWLRWIAGIEGEGR